MKLKNLLIFTIGFVVGVKLSSGKSIKTEDTAEDDEKIFDNWIAFCRSELEDKQWPI